MSRRLSVISVCMLILSIIFTGACETDESAPGRGGDKKGESGSDTDTDTDTDTDSDTDTDTDNDTDSDSDADDECYDKIDICFVLDVSTSMGFVLDRLTSEIGAVWDAASQIDDDPSFGLVVFVDDVALQNSGQPFAAVQDMQAAFMSVKQFTSNEKQPGGSPGMNMSCPENTLDALVDAAENYPWREGAVRIIIHATDDTFKENPDSLSGIQVRHTYQETLEALTSRELRAACFAAHIGECLGGNVEAGFYKGYNGMVSIPEATGGHVFDIRQVAQGQVSMADSIKDVIIDEYCTPYLE